MNNTIQVELNHLIILSKEKRKTADFLTHLLDLPEATPADGPVPGFFLCVELANAITILICEAKEHSIGHYAFKVPQPHFELVLQNLNQ